MSSFTLFALAVGLAPVLVFLLALVWLDSYKLVTLRQVLLAAGAGVAAAALSWAVQVPLVRSGFDTTVLARLVAPVLEELAKAAIVVWVVRTHRVGFLVDAAIVGFAAGAGFAVVENLVYLELPAASAAVWLVRGFGTAILHGGTTAIVAILSKSLADRRERAGWIVFLPGLVLAVVLHMLFNHFVLLPVISAALVLAAFPILVAVVFQQSERALERWLDVGFDADTTLLEQMSSGALDDTPVGRYLRSLQSSFRGEVVADMLCYLRLHVELSLRAKGELLMRESGFGGEIEPEVGEKLDELRYLDGSIGPTGRLALLPFLRQGAKEVWQLQLLRQR